MVIQFTTGQQQRLRELNVPPETLAQCFCNSADRDSVFRELETSATRKERQRLMDLQKEHHRPVICELENRLVKTLIDVGFLQVITPLILAEEMLAKMSINADHPLRKQVFWVGERSQRLSPTKRRKRF